MKKNGKIKPVRKMNPDVSRELMNRDGMDEMRLLDLVFIEEILNHKKREVTG